jgi:ABC-2 type transport system ATP-binding protein
MSIIKVSDLRKTFQVFSRREGVKGSIQDLFHREYSSLEAVDGISFEVDEGELLGYIGPNGAGKSTSIKMLTGILKPTAGNMEVMGFHPFNDRKTYTQNIGVVFGQRTQLWWDIAVRESFQLLKSIYDVSDEDYNKRLGELDEVLSLTDLLATPVRKLSLGQRLRCDVAASLLHNPRVLFLDEPTIGLDAVAKDSMRRFLRSINIDLGVTIILTTHDLREIEELCRRMVVIDHGKIIYDGSLEAIRNLPGMTKRVVLDFAGDAPLEKLESAFDNKIEFSKESERRVIARVDPQVVPAVELVKHVVGEYNVADMQIMEADIEEIVMKIYREGVA